MSKLNDLHFTDIEIDETGSLVSGSCQLEGSEILIDKIETLRKAKGMTDFVSDNNNDIWYNFYLSFHIDDKCRLNLYGTCNNTEKDDWDTYQLTMTKEEKNIMTKALLKWALQNVN